MSWMKNNYDPALEQYFYSIDTDRSGTIDGSELQRALAACNERSDPEFVGMLLRMFGKSRGGTLSFQDFNNVVAFMRQNNEAYNRHGGRPMDLATVEREVAETNRDFPGVGAMMPMVSTLFSSMGGQSGGVTADKFMLIQTFMSVIRGFMSSGGGGGAGGAAGLLGGLGGLGGLGSMLSGGALGGMGGAALGGAALGGGSAASGGYNSSSATSGGYSSAPPQQSYGSSAPSGYGGASQTQGYGGSQGGYGGSQGGHSTTSSGPASAGNMNSILDQIMGANLGSGASGSSSTTTQSYSTQPPAYGGGAQQSYGGGAQQSYGGGAQQSYGGSAPQTSQQGSQALSGFQAPSGYGAPAANNNAGPAFQGVD